MNIAATAIGMCLAGIALAPAASAVPTPTPSPTSATPAASPVPAPTPSPTSAASQPNVVVVVSTPVDGTLEVPAGGAGPATVDRPQIAEVASLAGFGFALAAGGVLVLRRRRP